MTTRRESLVAERWTLESDIRQLPAGDRTPATEDGWLPPHKSL